MPEKPEVYDEVLPHLFRQEYSKLTAVLSRLFGLEHIEIAEDIASETFFKASELWSLKGLPENPTAWIYTVAKNKTRDYLKRNALFEQKIRLEWSARNAETSFDPDFSFKNVNDSQLEMIFAVCDPANSPESQISLALQILCGFSIEEIANAFLTSKETVKKRLLRARENLRKKKFKLHVLPPSKIHERLHAVLTTIYLLFNEGYFSKSNSSAIRNELCSEAIRLGLVLVENALTKTPESSALLSLMCFQSSRFEARQNEMNELIPFEEQDKALWSQDLIQRGIYYLTEASDGERISKYHLEACIAYWHVTAGEGKWPYILQLYDRLIEIERSPMASLNRAFAFAKVYGWEQGILETKKLGMEENNYYHTLLGFLYSPHEPNQAIVHYLKALNLTKSEHERKSLGKELDKLTRDQSDS